MKSLCSIAVIAAFFCVSAAAEKTLKQGESEVYNEVVKDLSGTNFAKALVDLDTWRQKISGFGFRG